MEERGGVGTPVGWAAAAEDAIVATLSDLADPEQAGQMAAYMRDQFEFLGIKARPRDRAWRQVRAAADAAHGRPDGDELFRFARAMWERPEREYPYVGAKALAARAPLLGPQHLDGVRELLTTDPWWDTVDILAPNVVGRLASDHASEVVPVLDQWVTDEDRWLVRTAVIHQLEAKEQTDVERLERYCTLAAPHPDFFVRKAIGWALRRYSYVDAEWVEAFVASTELSALSGREALKAIRRHRADG